MNTTGVKYSPGFCGRMYVNDEYKSDLKETLQEMDKILNDDQKDEFISQLTKIKDSIKDKDIDVVLDGCPSSSFIGETRFAIKQSNGGNKSAKVLFVPESKGSEESGFYNKDEIYKLANHFLMQTAEYSKKDNDSLENKVFSLLG